MVKRLLETIVVPAFADSLGLEEEDVQVLFGPEVPRNRELRAQRVNWMNRLFVPLAQAYLNNAGDDVAEPITHTDPGLVDPVVVESLQKAFDRLRGPGYYNAQQELNLVFDKTEFEGVVYDTFADLLYDFCHRIVEHETDVVILAGLPSKLGYIQQLVKMYVPLSPSRIVAMHNHYAGNWYPYQDEKGHNPGVIIDPKSPVVVGAAIEFMARHGMLPQFKFDMKGRTHENTYYWGVMTDATSGIRPERILFEPVTEQSREDITEFQTSSQRVLIGRKLSGDEGAQATPGLSPEDRSGRSHRADADQRQDQTQARHQGPGRGPRDRPGHRRRGRRRRRARRERVLLLADLGRRTLLPRHRRTGQYRIRKPIVSGRQPVDAMPLGIRPTNDFAFKRIFGSAENKVALHQLGRYNMTEADLRTARMLDCWLYWFMHAHEYEPEALRNLFPQEPIRQATEAITELLR